MKFFLAWMLGWFLAVALTCIATRRKVVISATDAGEWQKITSRDIRTLRPVNAEPLTYRRGNRVVVIDRGCAQ